MRFDIDDVTFDQAMRAVNMVTDSFTVPLDAHRALVAKDTRDNRQQYMREEFETIYLGGLSTADMTEVGNMAKTVFQVQQVAVQQSAGTLTIRATTDKLNAFNATLRELLDGRSQVLLDVRLIQLAHTNQRNTGLQLPQQITAFNVYAEEQAILTQNAALVQQIISSGLAAPGIRWRFWESCWRRDRYRTAISEWDCAVWRWADVNRCVGAACDVESQSEFF